MHRFNEQFIKAFYVIILREFGRGIAEHWVDQVPNISDFAIEITAIEPAAPLHDPLVTYLPLRIPLSNDELKMLVQPHRATIIDVTLLRLPSPKVYQLVRF